MKILLTLVLFLATNAAAFDVGGSLPQGLGDGRYVQKAGDTMSGPLTVDSSLTVTGNAFSVGVDTFVVTGGQTSIAVTIAQPLRVRTNTSGNYELRVNQVYNGADYTGQIQNITGGGAGPLTLNPSGGNVGIGTTAPAYKLDIAGSVKSSSGVFVLDGAGSYFNIAVSSTITSATDPGAVGDIRRDANYIYVCTSANTWKRAALATWP